MNTVHITLHGDANAGLVYSVCEKGISFSVISVCKGRYKMQLHSTVFIQNSVSEFTMFHLE